ncbi:MAG: PTS system mannose/fructose/sorbose family transporter subunit IID [bacterium]|nr:PTS system mannose/fructose/sorbose family transporter subunit IID [bacterium]
MAVDSGKSMRQNAPCLSKLDLLRVIIRSFIFQGSWNFKKMQNVGFAFSAAPALRRLYPDQKEQEAALGRHLEFYNSHPYMASFVLGAIIKMEERHSKGEDIKIEDILTFKKAMMGPMGALGDSFFWASWRPFLGALAAALALIGWKLTPIAFLLVYNIPHFYVKFFGFWQGYILERGIVEQIRKYDLFRCSAHLKSFMLIILGAMIPVVIKLECKPPSLCLNLIEKLGIVLGILIISEFFRRKITLTRLLVITSSICILLGILNILK